MKLISVIIPIYNTQKYLKKCIDSVESQSYNNIEIILVNDGSTDSSEKIIQPYLQKYENIKYYKKENGGLSDARNYGIQKATGDYICFLDSDDYIDVNLFSKLQKYLDLDYDMIKYKLVKVDENYNETEKVDGPIFEEKTGEEAFDTLYYQDVMLQPAWLYLYKTKFWKENNFKYPVGKLHEDFALTSLIMLKAKKVASTNVYGYYYYQSSSSITRGNDQQKIMKRALDMLYHYDYMNEKIKEYNISKQTLENLKIYYTNNIILKIEDLNKINQKYYIKEIKKRKILKNIKARNFKQLLKKIILNINIRWYLKLR